MEAVLEIFRQPDTWKLLSIPVVAALVGWSTNWVAVKMMFYPVEPFGKPPYLGWQGILPSRAAKMGAITAETTLSRLGTVQDVYNAMDPEEIARHLAKAIEPRIEHYVDWIMLEEAPAVWENLPRFLKNNVYANARTHLPAALNEMMKDIGSQIEDMVDIKAVVIRKLLREKQIINEIFLECGRVEFAFIIRSGLYFGFTFGLIQMALWAFLQQWWILPLFGLLVGFATNWIAIRIIFQPLHPHKIGPFVLQGIFLKRQKAVAEVWCEIVTQKIITVQNIIEDMLHGSKSTTTHRVVRRYVRSIVEDMIGITRPVLAFTVGNHIVDSIKDAASEKAMIFTSTAFDDPGFSARRARVVKQLIQQRMEELSSEEFQYLLRPAFQEDELKLILLGAFLGLLAGLGQLFFVFGGF